MAALSPPVMPQLALSRVALPEGEEWAYEPKWDGFRAIAFVDGKESFLQSRNGKPLSRYFPELKFPSGKYVLDGEIVILQKDGKQDFDGLQQRIHPAESRIRKLAEEMPVRFVAFDLLAYKGKSLLDEPFKRRRKRLEQVVREPIDLTPFTTERKEADPWLHGAEGVIAKQLDAPYRPGERKGMVKVKRVRTIDAVPVGWRPGKEEGTLGSLSLALYDAEGNLREVGHCSGFTAKQKRELPAFLAPYETGERFSAEPSRWNAAREMDGAVVRPELVVEVTFDHTSNERIRHGTKLVRWRDDKDPRDCTMEQLLQ